MSQLQVYGQISSDPELKHSAKGNPYIHFTLSERVGHGSDSRLQTFHVWAWGFLAEQLAQRKAKRGNWIWATGSLELTDSTSRNGELKDKQLKLKLNEWGFLPGSKGTSASLETNCHAEVIDGEREVLPK